MNINKNNKNKRGFTIVELVIVIAVVAILSAVLIPTFSSLIKRANVTADQTLVRNLNTSLAIASDGKNGKSTMYETLKDIEKEGYVVSRLTPTSAGSEIVWDSEKNQFVLVMKDGKYYTGTTYEYYSEEDYYKLWKIYNDKNVADSKYSVYLSSENGAVTGEVTVNGVGFDAGDNTGITKVTYNCDNDRTNTIRTNGGELVVNAPNGTVKHYEKADKVTVVAVAGNSYHEYGKVEGTITIQAGHVSIEKSAEVNSVLADVKQSDNTSTEPVKITATSGSKVGTVVVKDNTASINVESGATVEEVAPATGVTIDSSKVTGIEPSTTEIDVSSADKFSSGLGTKASPFLINTLDQFLCVKSGKTNNKAYYKVLNDLDFSAKTGYVLRSISYVEIDGNGNTFSGIGGTGTEYTAVVRSLTNSVIRNIDLVYSCTTAGSAGVFAESTYGNVTFDNVDVYGTINYDYAGRNQSPYLVWPKHGTLTFNECNTYATINCTDYDSLFVGNLMQSQTLTVNIFNCANYGTLSGMRVAIVVGNTSGVSAYHTINIENTKNYGEVYGIEKAGFAFYDVTSAQINGNIENAQKPETGRTGVCGVIPKLEGMALELNANKEIILSPSTSNTVDIAYYVITASQYVDTYYGNTRNGTDIISINKRIENNELGEKVNTGLYKYEFRQTSTDLPNGAKYTLDGAYSFTAEQIANHDYAIVENNGEYYYLFANNHQSYIGSLDLVNVIKNPVPTIRAYAYDGQGNLLGMVTLDK